MEPGCPPSAPEPLPQAPPSYIGQGPSQAHLYPLACIPHRGASRHLENGLTWSPFSVLVVTCSSVCQAPRPMPAPGKASQNASGHYSLGHWGPGYQGRPRPATDWHVTLRKSLPFFSFSLSLCAIWGMDVGPFPRHCRFFSLMMMMMEMIILGVAAVAILLLLLVPLL